ncbi:MAG TPA: hypothetical protein VF407_09470, partial [Polyangiaceae bacterium]
AVAAAHRVGVLEQKLDALRATSPYRVEDSRAIEAELAIARAKREERTKLRLEEASLLRRLERLRVDLELQGYKKISLPLLENVNVAAPCPASWADMQGDTDVRFCAECQKDVFNLSMMSREEAEATVAASKTASICVRFFRRDDGTILTQDCPVGLRTQRFWRRTKGLAAAGLLGIALGTAYTQYIAKQCKTSTEGVAGMIPGR